MTENVFLSPSPLEVNGEGWLDFSGKTWHTVFECACGGLRGALCTPATVSSAALPHAGPGS